MKNLLKKMHKGEGGFTLIELLVVIVILGVIAAVVVLNVGDFMGEGKQESANTEAHQVQTAAIAYMAFHVLSDLDTTIGPTTSNGPEDYLMNQATLQAVYTITDGAISAATPESDGKWHDCAYSDGWTCP